MEVGARRPRPRGWLCRGRTDVCLPRRLDRKWASKRENVCGASEGETVRGVRKAKQPQPHQPKRGFVAGSAGAGQTSVCPAGWIASGRVSEKMSAKLARVKLFGEFGKPNSLSLTNRRGARLLSPQFHTNTVITLWELVSQACCMNFFHLHNMFSYLEGLWFKTGNNTINICDKITLFSLNSNYYNQVNIYINIYDT